MGKRRKHSDLWYGGCTLESIVSSVSPHVPSISVLVAQGLNLFGLVLRELSISSKASKAWSFIHFATVAISALPLSFQPSIHQYPLSLMFIVVISSLPWHRTIYQARTI